MTLHDVYLYYGIVISFKELFRLGLVTRENIEYIREEYDDLTIENISDYYWDWNPEIKLTYNQVPHDFIYDNKNYVYGSESDEYYYVIGIGGFGNVFGVDIVNDYIGKYASDVPEILRQYKPQFYMIGDDCKCCS